MLLRVRRVGDVYSFIHGARGEGDALAPGSICERSLRFDPPGPPNTSTIG